MSYRKCEQYKCAFQSLDGCPICPECKAKPREVSADGNCVKCHCCEGDEGFMRDDSGKAAEEQRQQAQIEKQRQKVQIIVGETYGTGQNAPKD